MAYVTGTAANFAALQTAIETAAVAAGYTLTSGILSKDGCFYKLVSTTANIILTAGTGQSGTALTGAPSYGVKIFNPSNAGAVIMTFPITYEIHTFTNPSELYCVIKYNSDFYQQLSFGKSNQPGIGGTGSWFSGSSLSTAAENSTLSSNVVGTTSPTSWGINANTAYICGFPFSTYAGTYSNTLIHTGLDSQGWHTDLAATTAGKVFGPAYCGALITSLPSIFNQAAILLPVKSLVWRGSGNLTIAAQLNNIRFTRIDNLNPGDVFTYGADRWKVYPFFKKNVTSRDLGTAVQHSGTFGVAIRYTGP
jgi:hypothetical protein